MTATEHHFHCFFLSLSIERTRKWNPWPRFRRSSGGISQNKRKHPESETTETDFVYISIPNNNIGLDYVRNTNFSRQNKDKRTVCLCVLSLHHDGLGDIQEGINSSYFPLARHRGSMFRGSHDAAPPLGIGLVWFLSVPMTLLLASPSLSLSPALASERGKGRYRENGWRSYSRGEEWLN